MYVYMYAMCVNVCVYMSVYIYVCVPHNAVPAEAREGIRFPWSWSQTLASHRGELNPDPLLEQQTLSHLFCMLPTPNINLQK